ncbi:MAG: Rpn family recombination-promoting nuclease/putative transposase [Deltaproteobacteria bacterium]|jgi:predicted transposase/invertase (TIGR01784 family)|nr:Rpn family recombination-promoting nuclease/putative transposase [Deltaproteobacteria bacterium]
MNKKPLSPTNDFVFKKVFGENLFVLDSFLKSVLDVPNDEYQGLEVLDPALPPENIEDKRCILDIKLHTKSGKVIDIEIQARYQDFIWKRIQYYAAKLLVDQAKSGGKYDRLPQVISILIADFEMIRESEVYHHRFCFYDEKTKVRFPDSIEINTLEIQKVHELDGTPLSEWMRFFRAREKEDFEMLAQTNPAIAEAWGVIKHLSADESIRMLAEAREKAHRDMVSAEASAHNKGLQEGLQEGLQKGLQKGLQEGLQKGRQEERIEVARNALREKLPVETVVKLTGLSLNEVEGLASDLQK